MPKSSNNIEVSCVCIVEANGKKWYLTVDGTLSTDRAEARGFLDPAVAMKTAQNITLYDNTLSRVVGLFSHL